MPTASKEIALGIVSLWDANGLESIFKSLWHSSFSQDKYVAFSDFNDEHPSQPLPNCIFTQGPTISAEEMSASGNTLRDLRETDFSFFIQISDKHRVTGDTRSSFEIGAFLVGKIMEVYGGHHETAPAAIPMTGSNLLRTTLLWDESSKRIYTGNEEKLDFQGVVWTVAYETVVDTAVLI